MYGASATSAVLATATVRVVLSTGEVTIAVTATTTNSAWPQTMTTANTVYPTRKPSSKRRNLRLLRAEALEAERKKRAKGLPSYTAERLATPSSLDPQAPISSTAPLRWPWVTHVREPRQSSSKRRRKVAKHVVQSR
jgi:hypothetical protein